ncbi:hypothetical protein BpJC7_03980 [Weizmannia acidilactici]|uniref:Uncharacterized protein n=1 Tax=Weizmannia acidilactici TaxID=2607726 RepID=A0A5J4JET8_9BACI|nr:hypothetical protein [Weizmannia acidilactici]GER66269.1 hypothetical protein BpJC4_07400 [Weizmannia acidilactici]GER69095.1 hypothetical protein BpJC7_03980 [Weizmannia acidilactici]GER72208.1 hypothetical protein BpPP18_02750 [Weizmannia acidilactici]
MSLIGVEESLTNAMDELYEKGYDEKAFQNEENAQGVTVMSEPAETTM